MTEIVGAGCSEQGLLQLRSVVLWPGSYMATYEFFHTATYERIRCEEAKVNY